MARCDRHNRYIEITLRTDMIDTALSIAHIYGPCADIDVTLRIDHALAGL